MENLILVPHFALSASAIEPRKPLSSTARRAGWIGCFIALKNIPSDAKIRLVENGITASHAQVRHRFERLRPLGEVDAQERSWTFDVLQVVRSLGKKVFSKWKMGRSYLCRIIDMLQMGYVDEVLFGYEVVERLPSIVKEWVAIARERINLKARLQNF